MRPTSWSLPIVFTLLAVGAGPAAGAVAAEGWEWPLDPVPRVVRGFEPPSSPYGPGHRGVDLAGSVGQPVLAIGAGTVAFAGSVAGRGVVVVDHGRLESTYQPVNALVSTGDPVESGQPIGFLELIGSHCLPDACLHLGVKRGDDYLDPLSLLPARPVRLKPLGGLDSRVWAPRAPPPWTPPLGAWVGLAVGAA
jgi:murein DD-endopeptidase MepM/ murein hydrolase activator NlpD